jgi:hypothetical protein
MTTLTVLTGHTTPETAYGVDSYPYGFTLRCKIRYWLEFVPRKGFRFCSQTTNPKRPAEHWNAPKKSTYRALAVMGLDEKNHVQWDALGLYSIAGPELANFGDRYAAYFDDNQAQSYAAMMKVQAQYKQKHPELFPPTVCCERDHDKDGNCDIHESPGVLRNRVETQEVA